MQYHHRNYEQLLKKKKNEIALNNIFYIERPTINFNKTINLILSNIKTINYNFRNDDRLKDIELPFSLENGLPLIALNAIPFNQLRISCTMFTKIKSKEDLPLINFNYSLLNDDEIFKFLIKENFIFKINDKPFF